MEVTSFKIAEQVGEYGIYGSVKIGFELKKGPFKIDVACDRKFARWESAILFGATYYLEHILDRVGLKIEVLDIEYHDEVDTNSAVIAYAIVKALESGSKIAVKREVIFDKEKKSFIFPK